MAFGRRYRWLIGLTLSGAIVVGLAWVLRRNTAPEADKNYRQCIRNCDKSY